MIELFCFMRFLFFLIFLLSNFIPIHLRSQDSTSILTDIDIQIEATSAINKMYNYEFDEAEKEFKWLVQEYKEHPLPVFLLGLSIWWKIDSYSGLSDKRKSEKFKSLDKEFLSLMDNSILLSKKVYEEGNKIDGAFFLAASYGFKGRLLSERRKWRAAAFAGMNALKFLKEIRKDDIMIPEISFGNGLFNYYSIWISDRYPLLKPIVALFPKGDKKLGIDQLNNAANNSFYTRTEAQYFLVRIFSGENNLNKSLYLSRYLHNTFPDNSIFHRNYSQQLYRTSNLSLCKKESLKMIEFYSNGKFGYNHNDARLAHFFLGEIFNSERRYDNAIFHLKKSLEFSSEFKNKKLRYTIYSNFLLGKIYDKIGKDIEAKSYFKKVLKLTNKKDKLNIESREYIKR
ncbi:MAG: tol-pal system protein YbgF [Rhodothermaeota bacterium MED-G19]|nr:MAG: tol-pal system protein YbgF [Rhodothermaeota bacterium MED-G19]